MRGKTAESCNCKIRGSLGIQMKDCVLEFECDVRKRIDPPAPSKQHNGWAARGLRPLNRERRDGRSGTQ
jgi:hypothetical protein